MGSSLTAGDGHPQDQSDQAVHLLLLAQPGQLAQVGLPAGVEEEPQLVPVVTGQTLDNTAQVSLHEDPACLGVGTEPADEGKFETECFKICQ